MFTHNEYRVVKLWVYYSHVDFVWAVFNRGGKEVFRSLRKYEAEEFAAKANSEFQTNN